MGRVYLQAEQVVTYIGPATELTPDAVALALVLWLNCTHLEDGKTIDGLNTNANLDQIIRTLHLPARLDGTWEALRYLFNRPWLT